MAGEKLEGHHGQNHRYFPLCRFSSRVNLEKDQAAAGRMKKMKQSTFGLVLIVAGAFAISTSAYALDFDFTIIGDETSPASPGIITGELIGLAASGTSEPADLIITSISPSVDGVTAPPDFFAISQQGYTDANGGFTVSDGQITSFSYGVYNDGLNQGFTFNEYSFISGFDNSGPGTGIYTLDDPIGAVSFSSVSVPEPSEYGFFVVLVAGTFLAWRRLFHFPKRLAVA